MRTPSGSTMTRVRVGLLAQAVVSGALAVVGPLDVARWLPFVAGVAGGCVVLAWFVGTATRSAWTMTVGFELLALVVGGTGFVNGDYVPGTVVGLAVLVQLLVPAGRLAYPPAAAPAKPATRRSRKPSPVAPTRLVPPPVVAAAVAPAGPPPPFPPPSARPLVPPPGALVTASSPPPPAFPPPGSFSGTILPGR